MKQNVEKKVKTIHLSSYTCHKPEKIPSPVFGPCTWTVFYKLNKCYAHNISLSSNCFHCTYSVRQTEESSLSSVLTRFLFVSNTHIRTRIHTQSKAE